MAAVTVAMASAFLNRIVQNPRLVNTLSVKEALIESGVKKLVSKMSQFKAQIARNSRLLRRSATRKRKLSVMALLSCNAINQAILAPRSSSTIRSGLPSPS
jgi:hypothetical protein